MTVRLCGSQLARLGGEGARLRDALGEAGHGVQVAGCLDRCRACEVQVIALADGMPLAAPTADALLAAVADLAAEDG